MSMPKEKNHDFHWKKIKMTTLYKEKKKKKKTHKKPTVSWQFVQVFIDTIHVDVHKNLSL